MSYKVKIVEKKDSIKQLEASIKDFFSDILNKTRGFKCQITLIAMLKKIQTKWRN